MAYVVWGVSNVRARGQNQRWPTIGPRGYVTHALSLWSPLLQDGGPNQKRPTGGLGGNITAAGCNLHNGARGKINSGAQVGMVASLPLP